MIQYSRYLTKCFDFNILLRFNITESSEATALLNISKVISPSSRNIFVIKFDLLYLFTYIFCFLKETDFLMNAGIPNSTSSEEST